MQKLIASAHIGRNFQAILKTLTSLSISFSSIGILVPSEIYTGKICAMFQKLVVMFSFFAKHRCDHEQVWFCLALKSFIFDL